MKYNEFSYIYPPRPLLFSKADINGSLSNGDWIAQLKLDDTRTLLVFHPDGTIQFWNRHKELQKAYSRPHPKLIESLKSLKLPAKKFYVFDALLLHSKNTLVKDTICLIDVLVYDNEYLLGSTFAKREELLLKICGHPKRLEVHTGLELALEVTPMLWVAKSYKKDFEILFKKWEKVFKEGQRIVEGLVFKRKDGQLGYHLSSEDANWLGKIRFPKEGIYRL
jgi:hypothetical protein